MELKEPEILGLYLWLKNQETDLDRTLIVFLQRLEKTLWQKYSIEEMENIDSIYKKMIFTICGEENKEED